MNKYNNYKKNDNFIVKAGNITLVGAEVGVGDKSGTTDQLEGVIVMSKAFLKQKNQ